MALCPINYQENNESWDGEGMQNLVRVAKGHTRSTAAMHGKSSPFRPVSHLAAYVVKYLLTRSSYLQSEKSFRLIIKFSIHWHITDCVILS